MLAFFPGYGLAWSITSGSVLERVVPALDLLALQG